ncbi:hypothetical protein [Arthrobacter sp. CDRTa11]|uniref:hypothetical protein n=1 Tax=Arthrobacter sp. CDRTa11 TaxID=2651199 RepID=UPI002265AD47|nr:hypothetical protein [Arthrobacter sp. CDRTa11]
MAKFRGLHVVAGIAAMMVAAVLGSAMKLNNTSIVMSSCVVFVAVAMWTDSALTRRRREALTLQQAASLKQATSLEPGRDTASTPHQDISHQPQAGQDESSGGQSKHEGNAA